MLGAKSWKFVYRLPSARQTLAIIDLCRQPICLSLAPSYLSYGIPPRALFDTSMLVWVPGNGGVATEGDGGQRGAEEAATDGPRALAAKVGRVTAKEELCFFPLVAAADVFLDRSKRPNNAHEFRQSHTTSRVSRLSRTCAWHVYGLR